jgi:glycosyltransferase involved in cell wall biosynthesis
MPTAPAPAAAIETAVAPSAADRPLRLVYFGDPNSIHTQRWSGWFADHGHTVTLLLPEGFQVKAAVQPGVAVERFRPYYAGKIKPWGYIAEELSLRKVLRRLRPDVVHGHYLTEYGWHAWMSGFHPYAITTWGSDVIISLRRSRRTAFYGRVALRRADIVTADSVALLDATVAAGARRDRTHLIQFGVNMERFSPGPDPVALRERLGLKGKRVLFSPRLITPLYRHNIAVQALSSLPADTSLVLSRYQVDESEHTSLLDMAGRLGVSDRVVIVPGIDHAEMPDFYRMADVVLSIPMSDATPVTLLEALSCGRPVVVSDLPSVREWMDELDPAAVVPVNDVAATGAAIERQLAMAPAQRMDLSTRSRAIVEQRAGQDVHMTRVEAIYREMAARR